jgi:hypothetical protein
VTIEQVTATLRSAQDVDDLIADLKSAKKRAIKTGGQYYVHRNTKEGQILFVVAISSRLDT